ncbi:MAG: DMT family transporter, partial [Jatrophihabitantaceae bacterium]
AFECVQRDHPRCSLGPPPAALLGTASGASFGLTAALMKAMTETFAHGFLTIFTTWQTYAMVAAGGLAMFLLQSALNAGRLIAAQPGITTADPVVSILWGVLGFGETVRGGVFLLLAAVSAAVIGWGVFLLARSPLIAGAEGAAEPEDEKPAARPPDSATSVSRRGHDR